MTHRAAQDRAAHARAHTVKAESESQRDAAMLLAVGVAAREPVARAKHVLNRRQSTPEAAQLIRHRCSVFLMIFYEMCSMGASWCHMINGTNRVVALKLTVLTEKTHRLPLLLFEACAAHLCLSAEGLCRPIGPVSELHVCSVSARPQD